MKNVGAKYAQDVNVPADCVRAWFRDWPCWRTGAQQQAASDQPCRPAVAEWREVLARGSLFLTGLKVRQLEGLG
jgi:hypothetical protein